MSELRPTVLMIGSLPLAAPWNGADKNVARSIVTLDPGTDYVLQTGMSDEWPSQVRARRAAHPSSMPNVRERARGALTIARTTFSVDLVHVVASVRRTDPLPARLLRTWSRLSRRPLIHTVPGIGIQNPAPGLFPGQFTVVFSDHTAHRLESAGVTDVVRVFPPLDLSAIRTTEPAAREVRDRLALGPRAILYPTHLDPDNGVRQAIRALASLDPQLADVRLVVAARGRAGQDLDAELDALRHAAAESGVGDRLVLLGHVDDLFALISACAVTMLVPRRLSGKMDLPLVILESLALGRPVVVTDEAPLSEALLDGGLAVPFGDHAALVAALERLLGDADVRREFASSGRRRLDQASDPARTIATYRRLYDAAIGRSS